MSELKPCQMTADEAISALEMCQSLMLFDPMTGETHELCEENKDNQDLYNACSLAIDALRRAQPANDPLTIKQPEIVRCKDCTFWTPKLGTWKSWGACSKVAERYTEDSESSMDCDTNYNDFCSYGERKDGAEWPTP